MNKQYHYYVVYLTTNKEIILGRAKITYYKKIDSISDLESISDYISNNYCNGGQATILNYFKLK